jgi:hypothetical protein
MSDERKEASTGPSECESERGSERASQYQRWASKPLRWFRGLDPAGESLGQAVSTLFLRRAMLIREEIASLRGVTLSYFSFFLVTLFCLVMIVETEGIGLSSRTALMMGRGAER